MAILRRLRRIWELSDAEPGALPPKPARRKRKPNAVFLPDMTADELREYEYLEKHGWKKFVRRITGRK